MDDSPTTKLTFRRAIAKQWQIPLFLLSMVVFVGVLLQMRPKEAEITFEDKFRDLQELSRQGRYFEFFQNAELVRQEVENDQQLGSLHGLAGRTRVEQLKDQHRMSIVSDRPRSAKDNYQFVINDYSEALRRNWVDPDSAEAKEVFRDVSLAFWNMNNSEMAISSLKRAIDVSDKYDPALHRSLVEMCISARPKGYLELCLSELDGLLANEKSSPSDRAWAFVHKAEVLIAQGQEAKALSLLSSADESVRQSQYGEHVEMLRGRAIHRGGDPDKADLILRALLNGMVGRGDIYAQVALELGKLSYSQFRDHDGRKFYQLVVDSQSGKDWYAAGKLGLAECAVMQHRYDEALSFYQDVVELLRENPNNRALTADQVQRSLSILANNTLGLLRQYDTALPFLELEQQIAASDDVKAANDFARMHVRLARQLREQLKQAEQDSDGAEPSETDEQWTKQQKSRMLSHFEAAGQQYLRVAKLAIGDDKLYGKSLRLAAGCYDDAGNVTKSIETWSRFVNEREGQAEWPEALYSLAQSYQSLGQYDRAIYHYSILQQKHPNHFYSFKSIVPHAKCYLSKEPSENAKAEELLLSVRSNLTVRPKSTVYRQVTFELGELYYNIAKYNLSITFLSEGIARYPDDPGLGKAMFLVGDSYRKSSLLLEELLKDSAQIDTVAIEENSVLHRQHLNRAADYFRRAIAFYEKIPKSARTRRDNLYLRYSWLYQADCMFDLGLYDKALALYDDVVTLYDLTPTALMAFVQIANCNVKLGNPSDANSANQRALLQLAKMTEKDLNDGYVNRSKEQWQQWLKWSQNSGLW